MYGATESRADAFCTFKSCERGNLDCLKCSLRAPRRRRLRGREETQPSMQTLRYNWKPTQQSYLILSFIIQKYIFEIKGGDFKRLICLPTKIIMKNTNDYIRISNIHPWTSDSPYFTHDLQLTYINTHIKTNTLLLFSHLSCSD